MFVGLRESLNRYPKVAAAATGGLLFATVVLAYNQLSTPALPAPAAYCSDDDGKI